MAAGLMRVESTFKPSFVGLTPVEEAELRMAERLSQQADHFQRKQREEAQLKSRQVSRDPCWRCGVRGDIGCKHNKFPPRRTGSLG